MSHTPPTPPTRVERVQRAERMSRFRHVVSHWMHLVLFGALCLGLGLELYRFFAAQASPAAVAGTDIVTIAALVGALAATPVLLAQQIGVPLTSLLQLGYGGGMFVVPQFFPADWTPITFLAAGFAGLALFAPVMLWAWFVARSPAP